jgi:20S proteasome subunit beta 2
MSAQIDPVQAAYSGTGFNFDNVRRNTHLNARGYAAPGATKTGTTIVGLIFKDGVCLGADTRATAGNIVADKNCEKIHYLAPNIYCCGAGTAADTEFTTSQISRHLELHRLHTNRESRVCSALRTLKQTLYKYQGHVGAACVLGGVDIDGPHLFSVAPHGSSDKLPYVTMGSGSLAAMAVFEKGYKMDMEEEEAKELVSQAIQAGIFNDLGSGSNVDVCVIKKGKTDYIRPFALPNPRNEKAGKYDFKRGTTEIVTETVDYFSTNAPAGQDQDTAMAS